VTRLQAPLLIDRTMPMKGAPHEPSGLADVLPELFFTRSAMKRSYFAVLGRSVARALDA